MLAVSLQSLTPEVFGHCNRPRFPQHPAHQLKQWTIPSVNASLPEFGTGQPEGGLQFVVGQEHGGFSIAKVVAAALAQVRHG